MDTTKPKKKKSLFKKILIGVGIFFGLIIVIGILFPFDWYKEGIDAYNKRDFKKALNYLNHVKQSDKNYSDAIAKIQEIKPIVDSLEKVENVAKEEKTETKKQEPSLTQAQKDSIVKERQTADSIANISKAKENRKKEIEQQFSSWDGSHRNLERYIKQNMNDPDSYEHVSTQYWDMGDHLVVLTKYRGKNAYGGKVLAMTKAEVDMQGNVVRIME